MTRSRRFPVSFAAFAAVLVALAPVSARAMYDSGRIDPGSRRKTVAGVSFSLGASLGVVEGTATERVFYYPYDKKVMLSELTWDLKDVVMAGVHGSVGYGRRFRLNLDVWSALTEGKGKMVDSDWQYPDNYSTFLEPDDHNWTDQSRHPDTTLDKGTIVDLNLSVLALQAGSFSLRGIVGYKNDTWSWSSRGGAGLYSVYGFRDTPWQFAAGEPLITYEQRYSIPYIGVGAGWTRSAFQLETRLLFSPLVSAGDTDDHIGTGVLYEGDFSKGSYIGLGLNATWAFARHWAATLGVEYQTIPEITGDFTATSAEAAGFFEAAAGVSLDALLVTLGAGYRF